MLADTGVIVPELVTLVTHVKVRSTNVIHRHVSIMQHVSTLLRFVVCLFILSALLQ